MKFEKMHGIGNDYIYFNLFEEDIKSPSELSIKLSNRHFGVGSDGIVLIGPSDIADFSMRMFNADGSEAEMCGNASRCVGKFIYDRNISKNKNIALETKSGIKYLELKIDSKTDTVEKVRVNMGKPSIIAKEIPVISTYNEIINKPFIIDEKEYNITCVSVGNPHAVIFVTNLDELEIEKIGPKIEHFSAFPNRINVEFAQIINKNTIKMRVWERGSGETWACGTGACATLIASVLNGFSDTKSTIKLLGGDLEIEWDRKNDQVYLSGGAEFVFKGEI